MRKILFTSFFVGVCLLFAPQAFAATIYVDGDNGSDINNNGTESLPYQTISQALNVISGGDTIYCRGTIVDNPVVDVAGTASAHTTITVWPGYTATVDGGGAGHNTVFNLRADYVKINGLNITNANHYAIDSILSNVDYNEITDNNIYGLVDGANATYIYLSNTTHVTVSGNEIYGNGDDLIGILLTESPNTEISLNKIHDFENSAVSVYNNSYDSILKNNWIYNIGGASGLARGAVFAYDTYNLKVYNNVFFNIQDPTNLMPAIQFGEGSEDSYGITIRNNIFSSMDIGFVCDLDSIYGSSTDYNVYYSVTIFGIIDNVNFPTFEQWQHYAYQDGSGQEANPLFVSTDPAGYDFHVQASSPAIDNGEDLVEVLTDYDNEPRPYNLTDVGVDEMAVVAAPENLSAPTTINSAVFSWSMPGAYTATSYKVQVAADESFTTPAEFTVTDSTMELGGMSSAAAYYFRVLATYVTDYAAYTSDYSSAKKFVTYPQKVTNVRVPAKFITKTQVKAKWKLQQNVTGYRIKLMNKKGVRIKIINVKTNKNKKFIKSLRAGKTYKIRIRAKVVVDDAKYWGAWSKVKKFATLE